MKLAKARGARAAVVTFVERGGSARSFRGEGSKEHDLLPFFRANIAREGHVTTDEEGSTRQSRQYVGR